MTLFAYVQENQSELYEVNNTPLFQLIRDARLDEGFVFVDGVLDNERKDLDALVRTVARGDIIMVRALSDLGNAPSELVDILGQLHVRGIDVVSVAEPDYDNIKDFTKLSLAVQVVAQMAEKKRRLGMERAKEAGRMGRRQRDGVREDVLKLRDAGVPASDIARLCGIGRSTYYRIIKQQKIVS